MAFVNLMAGSTDARDRRDLCERTKKIKKDGEPGNGSPSWLAGCD